jgi:hypothetical protein
MKAKNRRSYARASTLLPAKVRRLPPTERWELACRIVAGGIVIDDGPPPRVEDEKLDLWLNMINAKLDYLIRLSPSREEDVVYAEIEPLNISGGGMSLVTKEHFTLEEMLEIKIIIRVYPPKVLYLYGNIVRIEAVPNKPDTYTLGIEFSAMREDVRDEILKFDFKKHRQQMMARKIASDRPVTSDVTA